LATWTHMLKHDEMFGNVVQTTEERQKEYSKYFGSHNVHARPSTLMAALHANIIPLIVVSNHTMGYVSI
jgi:hypothetical protein